MAKDPIITLSIKVFRLPNGNSHADTYFATEGINNVDVGVLNLELDRVKQDLIANFSYDVELNNLTDDLIDT